MKHFILATLALASAAAFAAPTADAPAAECNGVRVATGPKGKGYSLLFSDVQRICGSRIPVCEVSTAGGLDNLNALSTKDADVGFVQLDAWGDMKNGDENIASLQSLMPVNNNYLHVVTSATGFVIVGEKKFGFLKGDDKQVVISRFSELRGQTVAAVGSAQLLVRKLDKQYGYGMNVIDAKDDNSAFDMVRSGKAAAAFTVSAWPSGTVKTLTQSSGLTLVPFDAPVSEPYKVKQLNYKNIAVYNNNTLAAPNVLVTRPFTGARAASVAALQSCISQNMTELKEGNFQPAWNEVNVNAPVNGITQFKAPAAASSKK